MKLLLIIFILICSTSFAATKYEQMLSELRDINSINSNITELFTIGKNDQGNDIWGIKISKTPFLKGDINHLVVGTHHGNEAKSVNVSFAFINKVIDILKDKTSPHYEQFSKLTFHIIPALNITGYNRNRRQETASNGRSYDSNRDYPDACGTSAVYNLKSTKLLSEYMIQTNTIAAITIHGYIGTFTFPWGTYAKNTETADHEKFLRLATEAAVYNNYEVGTHADVIYPATGSYEDWAYHELGVWAMLLELDYRPDYSDDSSMMVSFFSNAPSTRSNNHEHGECRKDLTREESMRTRP